MSNFEMVKLFVEEKFPDIDDAILAYSSELAVEKSRLIKWSGYYFSKKYWAESGGASINPSDKFPMADEAHPIKKDIRIFMAGIKRHKTSFRYATTGNTIPRKIFRTSGCVFLMPVERTSCIFMYEDEVPLWTSWVRAQIRRHPLFPAKHREGEAAQGANQSNAMQEL